MSTFKDMTYCLLVMTVLLLISLFLPEAIARDASINRGNARSLNASSGRGLSGAGSGAQNQASAMSERGRGRELARRAVTNAYDTKNSSGIITEGQAKSQGESPQVSQQVLALAEQIKKRDAEIAQLGEDNTILKSSISKVQKVLETFATKMQQAVQTAESAKAENKRLREKMEAMESNNAIYQKQISDLEAAIKKMAESKPDMSAMQKRIDGLVDGLRTLAKGSPAVSSEGRGQPRERIRYRPRYVRDAETDELVEENHE